MNQSTAILIGAGMIAVAALAATTGSTQAQFGSRIGNYMIVSDSVGHGVFRLDTSTGEVRYCLWSADECRAPFQIRD